MRLAELIIGILSDVASAFNSVTHNKVRAKKAGKKENRLKTANIIFGAAESSAKRCKNYYHKQSEK